MRDAQGRQEKLRWLMMAYRWGFGDDTAGLCESPKKDETVRMIVCENESSRLKFDDQVMSSTRIWTICRRFPDDLQSLKNADDSSAKNWADSLPFFLAP